MLIPGLLWCCEAKAKITYFYCCTVPACCLKLLSSGRPNPIPSRRRRLSEAPRPTRQAGYQVQRSLTVSTIPSQRVSRLPSQIPALHRAPSRLSGRRGRAPAKTRIGLGSAAGTPARTGAGVLGLWYAKPGLRKVFRPSLRVLSFGMKYASLRAVIN